MRGQEQAHSSVAKGVEHARDDWRSPRKVLDCVEKISPIYCDPAGNADNSTGATLVYSGPDGNGLDGLTEPWSLDGLNYVNWEYSQSLRWAKKIVHEAERGCAIVGLGPARPDTAWHRRLMNYPDALVAFWRGRIVFDLPPNVKLWSLQTKDVAKVNAGLSFKIVAEQLAQVPGVLAARLRQGYIYIEADIELDITVELELPAKPMKPQPAPFPSAFYFHNIPEELVVDAFGKVADVYRRIS